MKIWIYLLLVVVVLVIVWLVKMIKKYGNPYRTIMVFGKKGSGKTTLLVKLALKHKKKGWNVFSTMSIPGCSLIKPDDLGTYAIPKHSCILIDEVGMIWDNRDFKNFKVSTRDYFKLQRQYKHKVYLFSQTFDVDIKIRNLCDSMYMCFCLGGFFSYAKEIRRKLVVVKPTPDAESRIADELIISPFFLFPFGSRIFTWIPHWIPYFSTGYMAKRLPVKSYECIPDMTIEKKSLVKQVKEFIADQKAADLWLCAQRKFLRFKDKKKM